MKTAMQQLIEWVDEYVKAYGMYPNEWEVTQKAKALLSIETEQMAACFRNGFIEGMSQHAGLPRRYKEFEDYYNSIFEDKLPTKPTTETLFKNKNNGTERI